MEGITKAVLDPLFSQINKVCTGALFPFIITILVIVFWVQVITQYKHYKENNEINFIYLFIIFAAICIIIAMKLNFNIWDFIPHNKSSFTGGGSGVSGGGGGGIR